MTAKRLGAAIAAVGFLLGAGSASAAVYTITYSGVIVSGYDHGGSRYGQNTGGAFEGPGVFGVNGDLANYGFTAVFTVDTGHPGATLVDPPGASSGVFGYGAFSPVSAVLTINGVAVNFGTYLGQQSEDATTADRLLLSSAEDLSSTLEAACAFGVCDLGQGGQVYVSLAGAPPFLDGDVQTTPGDLAGGDIGYQNAYFGLYSHERYSGVLYYNYDAQGIFDIQSVTFAGGDPEGPGVSPVPEPAAWALMIMGFLGAGARLRRQRTAQA